MRTFYVYILSNPARTLYIGMTNDIERRVFEHKTGRFPGFTERYELCVLVYYEELEGPWAAIQREKQLKGWLRRRKIELIEKANPQWDDLSTKWYGPTCRFQVVPPATRSFASLKDDDVDDLRGSKVSLAVSAAQFSESLSLPSSARVQRNTDNAQRTTDNGPRTTDD